MTRSWTGSTKVLREQAPPPLDPLILRELDQLAGPDHPRPRSKARRPTPPDPAVALARRVETAEARLVNSERALEEARRQAAMQVETCATLRRSHHRRTRPAPKGDCSVGYGDSQIAYTL